MAFNKKEHAENSCLINHLPTEQRGKGPRRIKKEKRKKCKQLNRPKKEE
jgi:hypothetical protein